MPSNMSSKSLLLLLQSFPYCHLLSPRQNFGQLLPGMSLKLHDDLYIFNFILTGSPVMFFQLIVQGFAKCGALQRAPRYYFSANLKV